MRKTRAVFYPKNFIPCVKYGVGNTTVWACFVDSGPGWLAIIDEILNSELYWQTVQENVRVSVCELKLKRKWSCNKTMTQKSKSYKKWL